MANNKLEIPMKGNLDKNMWIRIISIARLIKPLVPASIWSSIKYHIDRCKFLPDRKYMEQIILPQLSNMNFGTILFVGVERYTKNYGEFFLKKGSYFWTIDIRKEVACFGSSSIHVVGDLLIADMIFPKGKFDVVIFNGVLGFGIDDRADQNRAIHVIGNIIKANGILLIGWNTDRVEDPRYLQAMAEIFIPCRIGNLPDRRRFDRSTHVYDLYRRTDELEGSVALSNGR